MFQKRRSSQTPPLLLTNTLYNYSDYEVSVFTKLDLGIIKEGVGFTVSGFMPLNCESFSIQLILGTLTRDIALLVNVRLPQNYIVRNSRLLLKWGIDENASVFPFTLKRGSRFTIMILITDPCYLISLNGGHFARYEHRVLYKTLICIKVLGDVTNVNVERREVTEYPDKLPVLQLIKKKGKVKDSNPMPTEFSQIALNKTIEVGLPLPYYGFMSKRRFGYGYHLRFDGRVKLLPLSFYINLQSGQSIWPHPIVALHFHCVFSMHQDYIGKNVITQNCYYDGSWDQEEVSELTTDLCPAKRFTMVIIRRSESYEVYVNNKFITKFIFRINPNIVDTVCVLGDVKLWDVTLNPDDEFEYTASSNLEK